MFVESTSTSQTVILEWKKGPELHYSQRSRFGRKYSRNVLVLYSPCKPFTNNLFRDKLAILPGATSTCEYLTYFTHRSLVCQRLRKISMPNINHW